MLKGNGLKTIIQVNSERSDVRFNVFCDQTEHRRKWTWNEEFMGRFCTDTRQVTWLLFVLFCILLWNDFLLLSKIAPQRLTFETGALTTLGPETAKLSVWHYLERWGKKNLCGSEMFMHTQPVSLLLLWADIHLFFLLLFFFFLFFLF